MNRLNEWCQVAVFAVVLIAISPILLVWWAWDFVHGRSFFDDLNDDYCD